MYYFCNKLTNDQFPSITTTLMPPHHINHERPMKKSLLTALCMLMSMYAYSFEGAIQQRYDSIASVITGCSEMEQPQKLITAFGAKGDGTTDCKRAFDKAMAAARKSRTGMHIIVPEGTWYVKGPIHLTSNVTLELQEGATIKFAPEPQYYLPMVQTSWEGSFCQNHSPFIYAFQVENVRIIGRGVIDGNCMDTFPTWRANQKADQQKLRGEDHAAVPVALRNYGDGHLLRPHLIQFFACRNITLEDFFITNSPFWCVHLLKSENIVCRGLRYDAKLVNNDGIDPEMSRNILIEDVHFNNGDDNVAIKAGRDNDGWGDNSDIAPPGQEDIYRPQPTENIIIRNCHFKGLHGVVIGSEMSGGVQNVFVKDCDYAGYNKRALYVKSNPNRGGFVRHIYFENCRFDEVEDMFYITSMYAGEGADDNHFTAISDIHVTDVSCRKARNAAIVLQGTKALPLRRITFERLNVGESKIGFSSMYAPDVRLSDCNLGGIVDGAPSQVSKHDGLFDKDK